MFFPRPVIAGERPVIDRRRKPLSDNNSLNQSPVSPVSPVPFPYARDATHTAFATACVSPRPHGSSMTGETGETGDSRCKPLSNRHLVITGTQPRAGDCTGDAGPSGAVAAHCDIVGDFWTWSKGGAERDADRAFEPNRICPEAEARARAVVLGTFQSALAVSHWSAATGATEVRDG